MRRQPIATLAGLGVRLRGQPCLSQEEQHELIRDSAMNNDPIKAHCPANALLSSAEFVVHPLLIAKTRRALAV